MQSVCYALARLNLENMLYTMSLMKEAFRRYFPLNSCLIDTLISYLTNGFLLEKTMVSFHSGDKSLQPRMFRRIEIQDVSISLISNISLFLSFTNLLLTDTVSKTTSNITDGHLTNNLFHRKISLFPIIFLRLALQWWPWLMGILKIAKLTVEVLLFTVLW